MPTSWVPGFLYRVSFRGDQDVLPLDRGGGYTAL